MTVNRRPNYQTVQEEVERILRDNYITEPPVKIEEIVANYGLSVKEADFEKHEQVAGVLDPEARTIYVNKNDSDNRKAFTIAHELGHWILHKTELEKYPDKYGILLRLPLGQINKDPLEKEANYFAAHLLVPTNLLDKYKTLDSTTISKIFGVSTDVIGYRMSDEYNQNTQS